MSKIRILYTIPNFDTAGSGKVLYDLVKGLDKDKFEVEVACSSNRGNFFQEMESLGVPIHILQTTVSYRPHLTLFSRIKPIIRFFKKNKYDIVHSWHWSSDWTEALAARLAGVKWVYTKKAMSWGNKHWRIRSYLANFIITINEEMKDYFPNKKNQELIPLGVDTAYYNPNLFSKEIVQGEGTFNLITVANLVPVKGIEVLLKAIKRLQDKTIQLSVLGDNNSEYGRYLKSVCTQLGIEEQVVFLGKKPDVRPFLANADLYVIPTLNKGRKEGMPMALVEAMSMGVMVLGSNISGINFVLKDFKELLFEAENEYELAEAINNVRVLKNKNKNLEGEKLRSYVVKNFNYDIFIKKHQELYTHILKK